MADVIYVVIAVSGQYSDRDERLVCWFDNEADAKARVTLATHRAREYAAFEYNPDSNFHDQFAFNFPVEEGNLAQYEAKAAHYTEYDPEFRGEVGYDDIRYHVQEVKRG